MEAPGAENPSYATGGIMFLQTLVIQLHDHTVSRSTNHSLNYYKKW